MPSSRKIVDALALTLHLDAAEVSRQLQALDLDETALGALHELVDWLAQGKPPVVLQLVGRMFPTGRAQPTDIFQDNYLTSVLASIPDALLILSSDLRVLSANPQFLSRFNVPGVGVIGRYVHDIIQAQGLKGRAREVLATGIAQHAVPFSIGFMGAPRAIPARITLSRIAPADGVSCLLVVIEDVAERETWKAAAMESERRFRDLAETSHDGIIMVDDTDSIVYFNRAAERLFDMRRNRVLGNRIGSLIPGLAGLQFGTQDGWHQTLELQAVSSEDRQFPIEVSASRLKGATGLFTTYVVRDLTERKRAEESLRLAAMVYHNSNEGMLVLDDRGYIVDANPAFEQLRGFTAVEALGKHIRWLNSSRHDADFYRRMWMSVLASGRWQGEHWGQHKDGHVFPEWLSINTIFHDDGAVHRRIIIFSNITEIKQAEAIIWRQANFDSLTDLPNRQLFRDRLQRSISRARRNRRKVAVLFLDLDRFKEINDTLGHAVGDNLLREAGQRLMACVRDSDTVARLGGDEFTVVLDDISAHVDVGRVADMILKKMAEPFLLGMETIFISTSIGVTYYPDDSVNIDDLLNYADQAMYTAKHEGRNRVRYFMPSMQENTHTRMRLVNDMHLALQGGQFSLVYQPIIDLRSGMVCKAEALLRWQHPVRGTVPPTDFIPLAEENGVIVPIGNWVFQQAAQQAKHWRDMTGTSLQVGVNVSPVQFRNDGINLDGWLDYLRDLELPGQGIALEITEGMLMGQAGAVAHRLKAFRQAGMEMSLDDFGTGYSSLAYLRKFDIDYLKIDRSFVANLTETSHERALCEAIIVMAHKLGLHVIAEGIETPEQRDLLAEAGCDYGQGFLFSRPVPAAQFDALLQCQASA